MFRRTCSDYLVCFFIRTRGYGCDVRPAFPAPSFIGGRRFVDHSDALRRGNAGVCLTRFRAPMPGNPSPEEIFLMDARVRPAPDELETAQPPWLFEI